MASAHARNRFDCDLPMPATVRVCELVTRGWIVIWQWSDLAVPAGVNYLAGFTTKPWQVAEFIHFCEKVTHHFFYATKKC